jgi:transposase
MPCYVGLDASKRTTHICVLDEVGATVKTGVVETNPKAIVGFLRGEGLRYARIGMESWSLASWLYSGIAKAGLPIICIESWHTHSMLKARRVNKTDKNDARGIAEIMRAGLYKTVHIKTIESQRIGALLTIRKFLRVKSVDIENAIAGALLVFGVKMTRGARSTFERRVQALSGSRPELAGVIEPLLSVWRRTHEETESLETTLRAMAEEDEVCTRLMTAPGVGPLTALAFRATIDEPGRIVRSRNIGPLLGLTAVTTQSGEKLRGGRISTRGDKDLRMALFLAARHQFRATAKASWLRDWGLAVAGRRGRMRAIVAVARRLAVTLHRMWVTNTDFRWTVEPA